jgi:phosphoribosylformylglycinamidine (FGAM) synthase PurS component
MPIEISYAKYTDTVVNGVTRFESKRIRLEIEHNNKEQLEEVKRQLEEMCERWYGNEK